MIPEVFKAAGYSTAVLGKWGVGENGSTGAPNRKGVDYVLGYLTQTAAHDYYPPPFIWRNVTKLPLPENDDGKKDKRTPHPPLYWEFHEGGFARAVRMGNWKGVSLNPEKPLELYDLATDVAEKHDVAASHPEVVKEIEAIMKREHVPSSIWPDTEK